MFHVVVSLSSFSIGIVIESCPNLLNSWKQQMSRFALLIWRTHSCSSRSSDAVNTLTVTTFHGQYCLEVEEDTFLLLSFFLVSRESIFLALSTLEW